MSIWLKKFKYEVFHDGIPGGNYLRHGTLCAAFKLGTEYGFSACFILDGESTDKVGVMRFNGEEFYVGDSSFLDALNGFLKNHREYGFIVLESLERHGLLLCCE